MVELILNQISFVIWAILHGSGWNLKLSGSSLVNKGTYQINCTLILLQGDPKVKSDILLPAPRNIKPFIIFFPHVTEASVLVSSTRIWDIYRIKQHIFSNEWVRVYPITASCSLFFSSLIEWFEFPCFLCISTPCWTVAKMLFPLNAPPFFVSRHLCKEISLNLICPHQLFLNDSVLSGLFASFEHWLLWHR